MRAARLHGAGERASLRVDDVPAPPQPRGTQLLVRVAASSLNGTDLRLREGRAPGLRRGPVVLGFDLAGEVLACGPKVTAFAPGDRVMALLGHGGGGQAEQVLVAQARAALVPGSVPLEVAAALPLAGLTALQALRGVAGLHARPSRRVLVIGAAGGIGSFAVQLAAGCGARVTAVTSGARSAYLRDLGADEVVDRHEQDVLAGGQRWDVVLDTPGTLPLRAVRPVLAPGGIFVSTRPVSADTLRLLAAVPLRPLRRLRPDARRYAPVATRGSSQDLAGLAHLVDTGRLRVPVDRRFPLAQVEAAHQHLRGGGVRGKVVVTL